MLPTPTLAGLRAIAVRVLDQTCTVQRSTDAPDAWGSAEDAWTTVAAGVPCLVAKPSAPVMQLYAARIGQLSVWEVTVPSGTDVRQDDQVLVAGQTLRVQAVYTPQSYSVLDSFIASEVR